ncbi:MAG: PIN domain-containing protein [Actinomycetaceae bacterium]|nr:PIN domain-containing protein [Actinomycetaceae bacterium]
MPFVVFDTNVLIAAFLSNNSDSPVVQLTRMALQNLVTPVVTEDIFNEYVSVSSRPKLNIDPTKRDFFLKVFREKSIEISSQSTGITLPDVDDLPFYEAYKTFQKTGRKTFLVTGNIKDFPVDDKGIVTPRELLDLMVSGGL